MKTAIGLLSALAWWVVGVDAQTTYSVADCYDLEAIPSIAADAVIDFAASPVSSQLAAVISIVLYYVTRK